MGPLFVLGCYPLRVIRKKAHAAFRPICPFLVLVEAVFICNSFAANSNLSMERPYVSSSVQVDAFHFASIEISYSSACDDVVSKVYPESTNHEQTSMQRRTVNQIILYLLGNMQAVLTFFKTKKNRLVSSKNIKKYHRSMRKENESLIPESDHLNKKMLQNFNEPINVSHAPRIISCSQNTKK